MKDKGFTLVELLGVLIVLSILGMLVSQVIIDRIKKNNENLENLAKDVIISSAREYFANNSAVSIKETGKIYCVTYSSLIENEYLTDGMVPQLDKVEYLKEYFVKVKYNGVSFEYEMVEECVPN